jgi:hypothetical protein
LFSAIPSADVYLSRCFHGRIMTRPTKYQTRGTAEHTAKNFLMSRGYAVFRVSERHSTTSAPIQLLAWNKEHWLLFIKIWSPRRPMKPESFRREVSRLAEMVRSNHYPGNVQFWVCDGNILKRYQILNGGAIRLRGEVDEIF